MRIITASILTLLVSVSAHAVELSIHNNSDIATYEVTLFPGNMRFEVKPKQTLKQSPAICVFRADIKQINPADTFVESISLLADTSSARIKASACKKWYFTINTQNRKITARTTLVEFGI